MDPHPPRDQAPACPTTDNATNGDSAPKTLAEGPRTVTSAELLRGGRELKIAHGDDIYRLLLTRTGKLLLQK